MSRRSKKRRAEQERAQHTEPQIEMSASGQALEPWSYRIDNGSKWENGFGVTEFLLTDYWTLRARSAQLFETNLYARGIIRRLVTAEINTGLHLEATPTESLLGLSDDELSDWSEDVERRFALWASEPWLVDFNEQLTFGALQAAARTESLISGDVLVVLRQDPRTGLPRVQLISGAQVQNPGTGVELKQGTRIVHGVELDASGRHVAFWVVQGDNTTKRLPAYGEKSGRRLAWLVYGTDKRLDDVRGKPLLAIVLQSLREIDRYRDSTQRKAVLMAMLAMFVSKAADKPGSRPMTGGAMRRGSEVAQPVPTLPNRRFQAAEYMPGLIMDELQVGEEPKAFQVNGTTETYGNFEAAIIQAVAWALEIPPEILTLSFNSNYSASQAAINEFKLYLNKVRTDFGDSFCRPIYCEWFIAMVLAQKVKAAGFTEAWRDYYKNHDTFAAWTASDWSGQIKPAVDMSKLVGGYERLIEMGAITRDRASRELTGMKHSTVVKKLRIENEQLVIANLPLKKLAVKITQQLDPTADELDAEDPPAKPAPAKRAALHVTPIK